MALYEAARRWHNNANSAAIAPAEDDPERLRRRFKRTVAKQREPFLRDRPVDNDVLSLLAALAVKFEEEIEAG